jgi:hypothetical protein
MSDGNLIVSTFPARPKSGGRFDPDMLFGHWFYQPKYNGWRAFIDLEADLVFNRHGELMSIGDGFKRAIDSIRYMCLSLGIKHLDAEALERRHDVGRGSLILLDLPAVTEDLETRMEMLSLVVDPHDINKQPGAHSVHATPMFSEASARQAWTWMQQLNNVWGVEFYEGLIAKKAGSEYPTTWKATDTFRHWVKFRFDQFKVRQAAAPPRARVTDVLVGREEANVYQYEGSHN